MPYTPHDWSSATWALMLTCMILFVLGIASLYLLLANRAYDLPARASLPPLDTPAVDSSAIPAQQELADITHDELTPTRV
ncbi:MAG TPA: hypothetical protein VFK41_04315 [Nocardioidaceae bacterium]|nr:hypothetical protein [Nocardioidaceae bacterium]